MAGSPGAHAEEIRVGWKMAALGMQVAAEVVGGAAIGWLYDRWQGTTKGVFVGAVAGIVIGLWTLVRGSLALNKQLERTAPTKNRGQSIPFHDEDDKNDTEDQWNKSC